MSHAMTRDGGPRGPRARRVATGLLAGGALVASAAVTTGAFAGPEWEERIGVDAGPLPDAAQVVGNTAGGPLASIRGRLSGADGLLPGVGDFQDMYLIQIVDPAGFAAQVSFPDGDVFDTQLFLFDTVIGPGGFGLLGNDEIAGAGPGPSQLLAAADDGSGFSVPGPGLYYLAISGSDSDPQSVGGDIFNMPAGSTEISGADGPGATAGPVSSWTGPGEIGEYRVQLQGCRLIQIENPCPADFDGNGAVDFDDLLALLSAWGPCLSCPFDLDGDLMVGFSDLLVVLQSWGPCPDF